MIDNKKYYTIEDIEGYLPIDENELGGGEFFGLVADGDSMINAGISSGDVVYIRRQSTADSGDIAVVIVTDEASGEDTATLKRFYKDDENHRYILHPENESLADMIIDDLRIIGVAVKVLKNLR